MNGHFRIEGRSYHKEIPREEPYFNSNIFFVTTWGPAMIR